MATTERQKIEAALENLREQILVCTDAEQAQVYADRLAKLSRAYRRRYNIGLPTNPLDQALEIDSTYRERPHLRYISDRVAQAVADAEQGVSRKLYVSVPPRQGKSLLLSIYTPLWMLRKHPEWHYMMLSSDKGLASNWAGTIRRTIEERPDLGIRIAPDAGAKAAWETEDGGSFFAASVKGNVVGKPAGVLILDDLVKGAQDAASPALRDLLWNSWMQDVYPRQQPPGIVLAVGTRWHMNDFASRLMSREYAGDPDEWEFINIPAFAVEGDPLGREVGEPLLSPLYEETKEEAAERLRKILRDVGSYSFSALYQGTPIPDDGAIFDPASFRFWTNDPAHVGDDGRTVLVEDGDLDGATWFTSWDLSFTDTGDYTVGQRWAVGDRGAFLVDQTRGKWAFTDQIRQMIAFTSDARTYNHLVERAANGAAALDLLKDQVPGLHPISATRNKSLRGRAVAPQFEAGTVFFPHPLMPGCSWVHALIKEVTEFDKGSHDDQVDAMTMALTWARRTSQRASLTVASGTLPQRGEGSRGAAAAAPSLPRGPLALPSRGMVRATPGTLR